jgi:long-chain acyl-CoA synthetase
MAVQEAVASAGCRSPAARSRGLRPVRDLARWPPSTRSTLTEYTGTIGLPMPSTEIAIRDDDGKVLPRAAGRDLHPRPAGDGGLLATPDETAKVMTADGFLHRRHRRDGRARLRPHRRPQEGHDPGVGLQRVSERDRGRGRRHPGRARVRGGRRARREVRRGGEAVRGQEGPGADRGGRHQALPRAPHRLQGAEVHRVPRPSCRRPTSARSCGASCATR